MQSAKTATRYISPVLHNTGRYTYCNSSVMAVRLCGVSVMWWKSPCDKRTSLTSEGESCCCPQLAPPYPLTSCTYYWCMTHFCDLVYEHHTGNLVLTHMPCIKMTAHISNSTKSYSERHLPSMEASLICF